MILSVSRRTDIPAFYTEWFMNRLRAGFVCVRNPMNQGQISRIVLNPEVVDCIVFWTKNPEPLLDQLDAIDAMGYPYYFQFTITPYNSTMETALGDKNKIIETFAALSRKIGKDKVVWRYDPIIVNDKLTPEAHLEAFDKMAAKLMDFTNECVISFVDPYRKTKRQMGDQWVRELTENEMRQVAAGFSRIASRAGISLKTCAERMDLEEYGIGHASCIDRRKIERILSCPLTDKVKRDSQREACGCMECMDIGAYNTCRNGCRYCYATFSPEMTIRNCRNHDPHSALLIGGITAADKVTDRKCHSLKDKME